MFENQLIWKKNEIVIIKNFRFPDFSTLKCHVSVNIDRDNLICVSFLSDLFTYYLE